ncbi:dihydrofolate reductase family protein [Flammeovirgaceae bacterium SG7u.111]|nr:dihydrofolate reductase family protein [Flammeovirgaceae bacterium SG7u.132]WPO35245.1 dihydrofolate reductase family protein [Flammeovirgaceae bacterium SG7u.111]
MKKVKLYIATSLDGYIARPDGKLDWLDAVPNPDKLDYGYFAFYDSVDTVIMGRKTYEEVLGFGVPWPYPDSKSYVLTKSGKGEAKTENTEIYAGDIKELVDKLNAEGGKDVWLVGGGELVTAFLNLDLIDEMIISIAPTIIGEGIPLFPNKPKDSTWKLAGTESFPNGMVILTYTK